MTVLSERARGFLSDRQPNGKQKDFFDAHAKEWDDISHHDASKIDYICRLLDLNGDESILDIGTGTGVMIPHYLERLPYGHVTAVDFSKEMIRVASSKYPPSNHLDYLVSDVCSLEPSGSYDAAVCYSCFPHFPDPVRAIRSLTGTLVRGGKLMIAHSSSKEFINGVHREGGKEISRDFLPDADIMSELFFQEGIETVFSRDDDDYYIVIGTKL